LAQSNLATHHPFNVQQKTNIYISTILACQVQSKDILELESCTQRQTTVYLAS